VGVIGRESTFLRHLVEGSIDAGTLTKVSDVWQLRGSAIVPSGLAEPLDNRLDQAGTDVVDALKLLAQANRSISTRRELAGEDAVDAAEVRGLTRSFTTAHRSTPGSVTHCLVRPCGVVSERRRRNYEAGCTGSPRPSSTRLPVGSGRSCMSTVTKSSIWTFSSQQPRTRSSVQPSAL
jgi:hypothetical protein